MEQYNIGLIKWDFTKYQYLNCQDGKTPAG